MTDTLYLNVQVYPLAYTASETLYCDIWLASSFLNPPTQSTSAPGVSPVGSTTVDVVFGGTAGSITGLNNTVSYWLRVFSPQGYSHWFPVSWQTGNSSGAPMVVTVPAIEGPVLPTVASSGPASVSGPGLTVSPGDLLQDGGFTVNDAVGDGIDLLSDGSIYVSASGVGIVINTTGGSGYISLTSGGSILMTAGDKVVNIVNNIVTGKDGFGNPKLGFFGATPVIQPATPVTLADVIAALEALGLVTP